MIRLDHARWLIGHTRQLLWPLGIASIVGVLGKLTGVAMLVIGALAICRVAQGVVVSLPLLAALLVGLGLIKAVLRYAEQYAGHYVAFTALQRLRELFFDSLLPQAPAATQGRAGADLSGRATRDIDRIEVFFAHTLPPMVAAIVVPAVSVAWLATVDATLAVVVGVATAVALALPLLAAQGSWADARGLARGRGAIASHLGDDIQGIREVRAFGAEDRRLASLAELDDDLVARRSAMGRGLGVRAALTTLVRAAGIIALLAIGQGTPASSLAAGLAVAVALWGPSRGLDDFVSGLDSAFAATARVRAIIDRAPVVTDPAQPVTTTGQPSVTFEGVTFTYPGGARPALSSVTTSFPAGRWSCVAGVSGSGKSTMAALLMRGWDPEQGSVRLGGVPVDALLLDELRSTVAYVSQRPTMLSGDIGFNLRLAAPVASEDELWEALRIVDLDGWVHEVGLGHPVAARGVDVSGGQLQRLALARALVAQPQVLVLDEALSQLDPQTLDTVSQRLRAARPGMTIIEITHRADLIADDAHVCVIDAGEVVEEGTAGLLRTSDGPFVRLLARL